MTEHAALVREGLRVLVERESAKRLARLGGSGPSLGDSHPRTRLAAKIRGTVNGRYG
jgi:hypothetical protein